MYKVKSAAKKENIFTCLFALLLFATQVIVQIPNPFSVNKAASVNLATLVLIVVFIWVVLYRIMIKKDYRKLTQNGKTIFWLSVFFSATYFLLMIMRFWILDRLTISVSMIFTLALSITLYFTVDLKILNEAVVKKGTVVFLSALNFYALCLIFYYTGNIRYSAGINLLGNINVYVGVVLVSLPILVSYIKENWYNKRKKILFIYNIVATSLMLLFSGSRYGFLAYGFELCLMYIVLFGFRWKKKIIGIALGMLSFIIIFTSITCVINDDASLNVRRTLYYPLTVISKVFDLNISFEDTSGDDELGENSDMMLDEDFEEDLEDLLLGGEVPLSDPDGETPPEDGIIDSLTRQRLFKRAFNILQEYWLLGTGRDAMYMWGWGYQSSHNIVIDAILCYGILGGIIYLVLSCFPIWKLMVTRKRTWEISICCIGFLLLLFYSMLQPLLTNKMVITLIMWGYFGVMSKRQ